MTNQTPLPHAVELLPCPFCGSVSRQHDDECYFTALARLHAAPEGDVSGALEVMAGWNRRIAATPAQAAPEALAELVRAVRAEMHPAWTCNSYHPRLAPALAAAELALAQFDASITRPDATPSEAVPSPSTADERAAFESWVVKHPRYEGCCQRLSRHLR